MTNNSMYMISSKTAQNQQFKDALSDVMKMIPEIAFHLEALMLASKEDVFASFMCIQELHKSCDSENPRNKANIKKIAQAVKNIYSLQNVIQLAEINPVSENAGGGELGEIVEKATTALFASLLEQEMQNLIPNCHGTEVFPDANVKIVKIGKWFFVVNETSCFSFPEDFKLLKELRNGEHETRHKAEEINVEFVEGLKRECEELTLVKSEKSENE